MQLLRTLAIIIISYYLFRFIMRYIVPMFTKNNKDDKTGYRNNPSGNSGTEGEYVDYEEVE